jgi:peptidoglycan/LPS O-acetylase OafA/YrhL
MKARYEVLDGLRGAAALSVVGLHLCEVFRPTAASNPLHHAYLAVDFFFMLSGFVIGHAYDGRWARMTRRDFFGQRLRRLHPLVLLGVLLAAAGYLVERVGLRGESVSPLLFAADVLLAALLLPSPSLPDHEGQTYSLDGPAWSLGQEYLINVVYAFVGPILGLRALTVLVAVCGAALVAIGATHGTLHVGWTWDTLWLAPVRTAFPFFMGLLLQRSGRRLPGGGFVVLSLVLLAAFCAPYLPRPANGLFEAALVIVLFPLIIAAGAAAAAKGRMARFCNFVGELSYPIYIVHYPFVRLYGAWVWTQQPSQALKLAVGAGLALALPGVAWLALRLFDEPVRAWLGRGATRAPPPPTAAVAATPPASTT